MKGFRRGILRVFTVVPLIAFLIFAISALRAWGAGFAVTETVVVEKQVTTDTLSINPYHLLSALLVIIGTIGYLKKKKGSR